jgi:DNA-binding NarL/FixJ family response regulator
MSFDATGLTAPLTEKQAAVVRLIGQRLDYKHVAAMMGLSIDTVRDHAQAAARKMPKPYLTTKARIYEYTQQQHAA